jgi:tetratricopeptide (TPR) repeat protein
MTQEKGMLIMKTGISGFVNGVNFLKSSVRQSFLVLVLACTGVLLGACESPAEKADGYLIKARDYYAAGDLIKAEIEVKNTLQISAKNPEARYLLAQISESRANFPEMAQNLRIAIESKPDFIDARVKLGTLYVMGRAVELAEEQVEYLATTDTGRADVRILNARVYAAKGDLESAQTELEAALEIEPDNVQALGLLASIAATTDLEGALALVDKGISVSDDSQPLRLLRIQLLQQAGRSDEVEAEFQSLLNDFPEEPAYGYQYARFLVDEGRIDDVEPVLRDVVERDPENIQARLALTQFIANTKGAEAAEALLREFVEELPDAHELRMALARLYQATSRPDEAYVEYEYIADNIPNENLGLTAKARMAGILLSRGETEEGAALLKEVLDVDSANSDALLLRGVLEIDKKNYRSAVSDFRSLLRQEPENKQAQLLMARAHNLAGDVVLAKDAYRRVLDMDPNDGTAPLELARILVEEENFEAAQDALSERLQVAPNDIKASRVLIAVLLKQGLGAEAETEASRVAQLPGLEAVGDYLLGGVYQAQQQQEKAVVAFRRSLDASPGAREPLQGLIAGLVRLERTDEAIAYLKQITEEYPDNLYAKTLLGQVLAGSGDAVAAEQMLESTLESNESWVPAYTALAGLQQGDVGAQIDIYKRGLEAMPGSQEMALLLGTAYERSGRIEDAIEAYEEILTVDPELPAVANNLAALLADYRTDEASFQKALELATQFKDSDNPAFLDTLGWVHYRLGDFDAAIPYLEKSVETAGQVPVLRYHLGMAYKAVGKTADAKEQLSEALANENANFTGIEDARAALAEL